MQNDSPRIEEFLARLKLEGQSSPRDWQRFYLFLMKRRQPGHSDPPVPLILAAACESAAVKHRRLGEQVYWAQENGCLDEALLHLGGIAVDEWNRCPPDKWHQDSYPS